MCLLKRFFRKLKPQRILREQRHAMTHTQSCATFGGHFLQHQLEGLLYKGNVEVMGMEQKLPKSHNGRMPATRKTQSKQAAAKYSMQVTGFQAQTGCSAVERGRERLLPLGGPYRGTKSILPRREPVSEQQCCLEDPQRFTSALDCLLSNM